MLFAFLFLLFVLGSALAGQLPLWVPAAYCLASLFAFAAYWVDKGAANAGAWRTQEGTLHTLSLLGGWPGAMLAQRKLHHKTRKAGFQRVFWATVAINLLMTIGLLSPLGASLLTSTS